MGFLCVCVGLAPFEKASCVCSSLHLLPWGSEKYNDTKAHRVREQSDFGFLENYFAFKFASAYIYFCQDPHMGIANTQVYLFYSFLYYIIFLPCIFNNSFYMLTLCLHLVILLLALQDPGLHAIVRNCGELATTGKENIRK